MRPLRFVWGWIYVGVSLLFGLFNLYGAYQGWREAALSSTLIALGVGTAFVASAIGIALRRRGGFYFTIVLVPLFAILCAIALVLLAMRMPVLIEGFILLPAVVLFIFSLYLLFMFVYLLRRKSLFR